MANEDRARTPGQRPTDPEVRAVHAPWRMSYMRELTEQERTARAADAPELRDKGKPGSFFRQYFLNPEGDARNHVIVRSGDPAGPLAGLILLNKYPYANGHLLIALGEPRARLLDYSPQQRAELWRLTDLAVELCERTLMPQGVNIGLNQATAAGAGVPEHVHVHVVPRWVGDVNFISVVGQVRVIPGALDEMAARYRDAWREIRGGAAM